MKTTTTRCKVAIIGSGNIGTDLMIKVLRHGEHIAMGAMVGIDPASDGLARAKRMGVAITADGVEGLLQLPEFKDIGIVFDATSAQAHAHHNTVLQAHGIRVIDLTPAAIGPYVIPAINLDDELEATNINMVTCGGQATIPIVKAISQVTQVHYAEIVASISNRLLGILAHRVFEELFAHTDALTWSNSAAVAWFRAEADSLLLTEGAVLLMQGAGVTQQHFRKVCEQAICSLLDHLRSAGAVQVQTEVEFAGNLGAVPLVGKIDLLVTLGNKRTVALDIKWRRDNYYAELLRSGEHLQLALYSSLIEQTSGVAPATLGYFILESGALYVTTADTFPKAQVRRPPDGVTVITLLDRARATWNWRKQQLDAGTIEVVPEGATDEFQGPEGTLPVNGPSKWDRDHLVLLGGWQ